MHTHDGVRDTTTVVTSLLGEEQAQPVEEEPHPVGAVQMLSGSFAGAGA
jgi:hypothetical protein